MVPTLSGSYRCHCSLVFGPFTLNLFVKFVSSCLESIKLEVLRKIKTTSYCGSLNSPLFVNPDALASVTPFQQESFIK
jgi:hypothetical protein